MTSFLRLSFKKEPIKKEVDMKVRVIYCLFCVLNIAGVIKICNNTSNKGGLNHYFSKNTVEFRQRKNLKGKKSCC